MSRPNPSAHFDLYGTRSTIPCIHAPGHAMNPTTRACGVAHVATGQKADASTTYRIGSVK